MPVRVGGWCHSKERRNQFTSNWLIKKGAFVKIDTLIEKPGASIWRGLVCSVRTVLNVSTGNISTTLSD